MHISPWLIYFWAQADAFKSGLGALSTILVMSSLFAIAFGWLADCPKAYYLTKITVPTAILAGVLSLLAPSSKTVAMMAVIPALANSSVVQKDLPEVYNLALSALKEKLAENINKPSTPK